VQVYLIGQLVAHESAVVCMACGDLVLGAELDESGRCPACGPSVLICAHCGAELLADRGHDAGGDQVCDSCADDFENALEAGAHDHACLGPTCCTP